MVHSFFPYRLLLGLSFFLLIGAAVLPAQSSKAKNDRLPILLDSLFQKEHRENGLSGVLLAARNGKIIYKKALGYAHPQTKTPLKVESAFNLASVSKQFTTMCVMLLKEKGQLNYDDEVKQYLRDFPYEGITVRHLMTHTSGLPEYFDLYEKYFPKDRIFVNRDMLDLFIAHRPALDFNPGEKFKYSNTGYLVLAMVAESAGKQPFADQVRESIVRPLKLKHTYPLTKTVKEWPSDRVYGFHYQGDSLVLDDLYSIDGVIGDGNIYASAPDLQRWSQALYKNKLVSAQTLAEAFQPYTLSDGSKSYYGFGWSLEKDESAVSHSGSWVGFRTFIHRDLKGPYELVLLTNSGTPKRREFLNDLRKALKEK